VLCASALRDRYFGLVTDETAPRGLVWLLIDGYSGRLCALLHATRSATTLQLIALFVATDDLHTLIHENLLVLLAAFADTRGVEIENRVPKEAVCVLIWALLGFLWHPKRALLIRPNMREMVNSYELLHAVDHQITRAIDQQRIRFAEGAKTVPVESKNTAATIERPVSNSSGSFPKP
jgi:hypothetical protein